MVFQCHDFFFVTTPYLALPSRGMGSFRDGSSPPNRTITLGCYFSRVFVVSSDGIRTPDLMVGVESSTDWTAAECHLILVKGTFCFGGWHANCLPRCAKLVKLDGMWPPPKPASNFDSAKGKQTIQNMPLDFLGEFSHTVWTNCVKPPLVSQKRLNRMGWKLNHR